MNMRRQRFPVSGGQVIIPSGRRDHIRFLRKSSARGIRLLDVGLFKGMWSRGVIAISVIHHVMKSPPNSEITGVAFNLVHEGDDASGLQ